MTRFTKNMVWSFAPLCAALALPHAAQAAPVTAKTADSFVSSVGVHYNLNNTDSARLALLANSGIHVIRGNPESQAQFDQLQYLNSLGMKALVALQPGTSVRPDATFWGKPSSLNGNQPWNIVDYVKKIGVSNVVAVEMNNEMDNGNGHHRNFYWHPGDTQKISGDPNSPLYWAKYLQAATPATFNALKGDAATQNIPIIGPSHTNLAAYQAVGDLSPWIDYSNMHHYMAGRHPETGGWGSNGYGSIAWTINYPSAAQNGADKNFIAATEGGNSTADPNLSNHQWSIDAHGKYIPRYYLAHFNAGYKWTCVYRFEDFNTGSTDGEQNYGLIKSDGTPKPAYTALKNLLTLVKDPGTNFTPGALDYALSGSLTDVKSTLLQKRNGEFYLCLWLGKQGWNWRETDSSGNVTKTPGPITVAPQNVTLTFNQPIASTTVSTGLKNTTPTSSSATNPTSLNLSVSDEVMVVKIVPRTGLKGQYFSGANFNTLLHTQIDPQVSFHWNTDAPKKLDGTSIGSMPSDGFSIRWTGKVQAVESGTYTFQTHSDDGVRLWVNGTQLVNSWINGGNQTRTGTISLTAGQQYTVTMEYFDNTMTAYAHLRWKRPGQSTFGIVPQSQLTPAP